MTDWPPGNGDMACRIRAFDWAATPLGPVAQWPQSRRTAVDLMLASGHAMQLAWGPQRIVLYNDAYAPMLGDRHPRALGLPFSEAWPDIWADIEPLVARVFAGETVRFDDMPLVMTRRGYAEDTWWNFSYSPVRDESGAVAGLLNVTVDATAKHQAAAELRAAELRAVIESIGDAVYMGDAQGITLANQAALDQLGYTSQEQLNRRVGLLAAEIHTRDTATGEVIGEAEQPFSRALHGERVVRHVSVRHRITGEERIVRSSAAPVVSDGRVLGAVAVNTDITGLVRTEAALRQSEEQLRLMLQRQDFLLKFSDALRPLADPAQIKTVATTLLGDQLGVNRVFYADAENNRWIVTPGYERDIEPLPDRPFEMNDYGAWIIEMFQAGQGLVVDDMAADTRFDAAERAAHLALQIHAQIALPLVKDGQLVAMLVVQTAAPRAWSERDLALLQEAAQRTWAAVERARAEAALHLADRRKDEFLAVLAHELRNGLAPLVYNMEIANRVRGDAALVQEVSARTSRQLKHVVHLVGDLLDVARINTGKIELNLELVKAREVVNLALDACRADFDRKHHRLALIDEADAELAVRGDRVRLTQVVSNLLSNATKYTDAGGTITLRIAREGEQAVIEVSDTGIGIPPAALSQVFDLFTQVRNQQAYSEGGLGIGLSLVKRLVEMQGGSVAAASEGPGQGSRFTVRLPVAAAADAGGLAAAQGEAAPQGQALRVLVVDDQRDSADALAQLLRLRGHDAEVAYGGAQALDSVRRRRPELVLLDLGMPGMNGFDVARRLRAEFGGDPPMQIVALTGWGQEADRLQTQAAAFDGHLAKPPSDAELQAVLTAGRRPPA